jgi:hypothetical protein
MPTTARRTASSGKVAQLAGRRELDADQVGERLDRIDAKRAGCRLVTELTGLPVLTSTLWCWRAPRAR